jgi:hypothetical protein
VERCKKSIAWQGRYFEKEPVTAPPQSFDSYNKASPRTFQTDLVYCIMWQAVLVSTVAVKSNVRRTYRRKRPADKRNITGVHFKQSGKTEVTRKTTHLTKSVEHIKLSFMKD